jgi:hypothetical protein
MADGITLPTTQRAYTLRLRGIDESDSSWTDALWATHEAVNNGAKVFGEWLLTLRGGLDHVLADVPVKETADKTRPPTESERRDRRILLALSWLSVEDAHGAPRAESLIVARGTDSADCRARKLGDALTGILKARVVVDSELGDPNKRAEDQPGTWFGDCMPSLSAAIRDDAVWVNRSAAFDRVTAGWDIGSARKDVYTLLSHILSQDFLTLPTPKIATKKEPDADADDEQEQRRSAVKASSKGAGNRTRHPFSHLFGEGKPFGKPARRLILRDKWHDYLKPKLDATGIPVLAVKGKAKKSEGTGPAHTELQREMLSKAASRVAQIVTKQRQQETDRLVRKEADADLQNMEADQSFNDALSALRTYCDEYRVTSGATGEFLIRPRQVTGWDRVVRRWNSIKETDPERAREARVEAVKSVQEADEDKKFGDANLFFRLAEDRFTIVWRHNGNAEPTILERFVKGMKARGDSERLKVAAFRHPDPYRNPIFCQFGVSRPTIRFRRLKAFTDDPAGNDPRAIGLLLWHPASNSAKLTLLHGVSQRIDREIGAACDQVQQNPEELCAVSRRGRLGAAAGGLPNADSPARVAGVFDLRKIKSRITGEQEDSDDDGNETGILKEPKWNGTLSAGRRELAAIGKFIDKGDIQKANRRRKRLRWTLTISMEMEGRGPWFRYVAAAQDQTPFVRTARKDKPKDKNDATKGLAERKGDKRIEPEGWPWQEFNRPLKDNTDGTALVEDTKAARGDKACLILSRLPGLRVLSVDLGHRFAASCAVWEALDARAFDMAKLIADAKAKEWRVDGSADGLFVHIHEPTDKIARNGRNKGKPVEETTIYRRIGEDFLRDPKMGKPSTTRHPTPWARLDRQFFIKLQGEERPARIASEEEYSFVTRMETDELHYARSDKNPLPWQVDELMFEAVRTARLALRRHGDAARLAFGFASDYKPMHGARKFWFKPQDDDSEPEKDAEKKAAERAVKHTEYLQDLLCLWYDLAVSGRWRDDDALKRWNAEILPLIQNAAFAEPPPLEGDDANNAKKIERRKKQIDRWKQVWDRLRSDLTRRSEDEEERPDGSERKADREAVRALLALVAESLRADPQKRAALAAAWKTRWDDDDANWPGRLKTLRRWLMPRGVRQLKPLTSERFNSMCEEGRKDLARQFRVSDPPTLERVNHAIDERNSRSPSLRRAAMNVGGLSLTRLATLTEFRRQVQVGYFTRLLPDGTKAEIKENFAQRTLDAIERMREQRVKQIASRIVEAALGVGIECDPVWDDVKKKWRYPKRPRELLYHVDDQGIEHGDPRFKPCHAVVIENLRNYRPDELQTRLENRALMNWSAGKVRKYLEEACQLHGLHLREIMPNYTSRQDSRTGLPGVRCVEVKVDAASGEPAVYWWKKRLATARKKTGEENGAGRKGDAESRFLVELADHLARLKAGGEPLPSTVRVPRNGGDLFVAAAVSCDGQIVTTGVTGIQADLNAAANIGLRALLDPDFPGKWWYVPSGEADGIPLADKVKGAAPFGDDPKSFGTLLKKEEDAESTSSNRRAKKSVRKGTKDVVNYWSDASTSPLRNASNNGFWLPTSAYWRWVRKRVVAVLRKLNGLTECPVEDLKADDATETPF